MAKKPPRWYFSFRSPYSWLAYRDLLDRYPDVAAEIDWAPFWEPDAVSSAALTEAGGSFPYVPMSQDKHRYILQDMRRLASARGLKFRWPVDRDPHWEVAHLGYLAARAEGAGHAYIAEIYRSRWEHGADISSPDVVAEAAERAGLDGAHIAAAHRDPAICTEGRDALLSIYHDGVFGVPFFIHGYDKYWGVDRLPGFVDQVRRARGDAPAAERRPTDPAADASGDAPADPADDPTALSPAGADGGHAGGCG